MYVPAVKGGLTEIAQRQLDESGDHGWTDIVGQTLELHTVPGNHFSMITGEGVSEIARSIRSLLGDSLDDNAPPSERPRSQRVPLGG